MNETQKSGADEANLLPAEKTCRRELLELHRQRAQVLVTAWDELRERAECWPILDDLLAHEITDQRDAKRMVDAVMDLGDIREGPIGLDPAEDVIIRIIANHNLRFTER